jgi:protein CpxP
MKPWNKFSFKRTLFALLGVTVLVGGLTACGHRGYEHGMASMSAEDQVKFRDKMVDRVSSKLDLTTDQKQRLTALTDKLQAQRKALMGTTANPRADLQAIISGDKFDRTRAQALVTEKTAALTLQSPEVIAALADFYDSLNAAQQAKVREFMQGRHGFLRG